MSKKTLRKQGVFTRGDSKRAAKLLRRIQWALDHRDYMDIKMATLEAHDIHSGMGFRAVYVHKPKKRLNKIGIAYRVDGFDLMGRPELRKHKGKWIDINGKEFHIAKPIGNDVVLAGDGALELSLRDTPEESDLLDDSSPIVHVANTKFSRTQGREPRGDYQARPDSPTGNEPKSPKIPHVTGKRRNSKPTHEGEKEAQAIIAKSDLEAIAKKAAKRTK